MEPVRQILSKMFDKMELLGPRAGKLVDSHLFLYEMKSKHPPIKVYCRHVKSNNELWVFEYDLKTSQKKQQQTINKIVFKSQGLND